MKPKLGIIIIIIYEMRSDYNHGTISFNMLLDNNIILAERQKAVLNSNLKSDFDTYTKAIDKNRFQWPQIIYLGQSGFQIFINFSC